METAVRRSSGFARVLAPLTLALAAAPAAFAQCGDPNDPRPSVALVLSGGGALAASQLGALQEIEDAGVPISCVVGTSMGAILGSLYASGHSPEKLHSDFLDANWRSLFTGGVPYDKQSFRTKDTQRNFFSDYVIGVGDDGVTLPAAYSSLRGMRQYLRERLPQGAADEDFDRLPIPFRAVATNYNTGEAVALDHGDLIDASLASMAVPGFYPAQRVNGLLLIDGGMSKQLPIDVARAMGADIIIAIDTTLPAEAVTKGEPTLVDTINQVFQLQVYRNQQQQVKLLQDGDVHITPNIEGYAAYDFSRMHEGYEEGRKAAKLHGDRLRAIAEIAQPVRRNPLQQAETVTIASISVESTAGIDEDVIRRRLGLKVGDTVTRTEVSERLSGVYSIGAFEYVDYHLTPGETGDALHVTAPGRLLGRQQIQLGAKTSATLEGDSSYQLLGRWSLQPLNPGGGQVSATVGLGSDLLLDIDYMQPLGGQDRAWMQASLALSQRRIPFSVGPVRVSERLDRSVTLSGDLGLEFGEWGVASAGMFLTNIESELLVGSVPGLISPDGAYYGFSGRLATDTLNSPSFPTAGYVGELKVDRYFAFEREDVDGTYSTLSAGAATRWNTVGGFGRIEFGQLDQTAFEGLPPFTIGGFKRLSGYIEDSVPATGYALGRLETFTQLGGFDQVISVPVYVGATVEAAHIDFQALSQNLQTELYASSIYAAVDTPLGPAYLAFGKGEGPARALYIYFGRTF